MIQDIVSVLRCPACRSGKLTLHVFTFDNADMVENGVLYCIGCGGWYPISDYILELLPPESTYSKDKELFYRKYKNTLSSFRLTLTKQEAISGPEKIQQEHFDWYANNSKQSYDNYSSTSFWKSVDQSVFGEMKPLIPENALLLDVGCGQGRSTFQLSEMPIRIVAFDISKQMIRIAIKKYQQGKYKADITFIVADASAMPFKNHSFDFVMLYGVLHHLSNTVASCREIARILKSRGGTFFCLENNKSAFRKIFDWLQLIRPIWYEKAGSEPLISDGDLKRWFYGTKIKISSRTMTYVTPHFVILFPYRVARYILNSTDRFFAKIPWVNKQGGLIEAIGTT